MNYQINEGAFTLFPASWKDTTMNILRDDISGLTLVISRGAIAEGRDFSQEFHHQWDTLRSQMGDIQQSAFTPVMAGAENTLPAIEVETAFQRNDQSLWQRQLAVQTPKGHTLMIFTLSALRPFSEEDDERWSRFKHSLTLTSENG